MKLNKIAALCNKVKQISLYTQEDESGEKTQWAGDGCAVYALLGLPIFTAETIMNTFGVDADKKDVWLVRDEPFLEGFDLDAYSDGDVTANFSLENYVTYCGNSYVPVRVSDEVFYIKQKYLNVIKFDEKTQMLARKTAGNTYFVVTDGLFPIAMIMPVKIEDGMKEWLKRL